MEKDNQITDSEEPKGGETPNIEEAKRSEISSGGEEAPAEETAQNSEETPVKEAKPKKNFWKMFLHFMLLNLGSLLIAVGVRFFKAPNHFATGGVSGISIILTDPLSNLSPFFTQSNISMIINILLMILGFIFLGKGCSLKTLYCSLAYSGANILLEHFVPLEHPLSFNPDTGTSQPLLELVYAMLLTGIGSAILFNCKASSGGTDIVALILKKYTKLDTGKALLVTDFAIACCAFIPPHGGVQAGLFSLLGLFSKAFIIDGVIESIGKSKYITIITTHTAEIKDYILNVMKRDYTTYVAKGGYTGDEKDVLITVCKRGEALRLKAKVKAIDPRSFVIITDANEILGKGFRES